LLRGLAFSIVSEDCWDTAHVSLDCAEWDPEHDDIVEVTVQLLHVAAEHAAWIDERLRHGVQTGADLLRLASTLVPNLAFCASAQKQIEALSAGAIELPRIVDRLLALDGEAARWIEGGFDYHQLHNASGESSSTMGHMALDVYSCVPTVYSGHSNGT
jgi:hypothetical protein